MFLKEPLTNLVEKKPAAFEGGVGMFIVQGFFEMFEVLLSYFSNTLSFVRIGAYAVSHAAMMQVVLMLAGAENGSPNWVVIVLGNIFVCGLEGLIVGIQVLTRRQSKLPLVVKYLSNVSVKCSDITNVKTRGGQLS